MATKKVTKKAANKTIKVKLLVCPAGKYLRSENVGEIVEYPSALAEDMVENKYAEFVK